jgi:hypothetical protein
MFTVTSYLSDVFVEQLQQAYHQMYGTREADYKAIIADTGRLALEHIATSTALYHNVEHTMLVTLAGQEILRGKQLREGNVSPQDRAHVMIALCCHDIGYVRGVCRQDGEDGYTTGLGAQQITLPRGATDAALTLYHVDRGKQFVRERLATDPRLDIEMITDAIERTRLPIPEEAPYQETADYPGLVRAADRIGQMADPHYLRKLPALFYEFAETGTNTRLGYTTPADLQEDYPAFFWNVVYRYIQDGLRYLQVTATGREWIANLYAHVFTVEHHKTADLLATIA